MLKAGQMLREERIKKGLTLEEASQATKIKSSFLMAIERGDYQKLPSIAYAQGFVRNYTGFLGLPEKEVLALFRREFDEGKIFKVLPEGLAKRDEFSLKRFNFRTTVLLVFIVFLGLLGFIAFQYRFAFMGPPLSISSPKDMSTLSSSVVLVSGKTSSDAIVFVNDEAVSVNDDGTFQKDITVFPGKSKIQIISKNRFGKETEIDRNVILK